MPCSSASDIPNVDLPVPGPPLMRMSFGGSLSRSSPVLKWRRCFIDAFRDASRRLRAVGGADREEYSRTTAVDLVDGGPNACAGGGTTHDETRRSVKTLCNILPALSRRAQFDETSRLNGSLEGEVSLQRDCHAQRRVNEEKRHGGGRGAEIMFLGSSCCLLHMLT
jgi:hypothetical protein